MESLAEGKDVIATNKDKQEVMNYIEALEKIPALAEKGNMKVADLLSIHRIITKDVMQRTTDSGVFRNRQVFVGTTFKDVVEYMPPKTEDVPQLAQEFINWLNPLAAEFPGFKLGDECASARGGSLIKGSCLGRKVYKNKKGTPDFSSGGSTLDKTWEINPVLLAGVVHHEIARIHPFIDGNGRTARLLATVILYLSGFDHRRIFALDDYYDRDRQAYYAALKTAQQNNGDITQWLEYFTTGVAYSVKEAKEAVLKVGSKNKNGQKVQIALTPKQMRIVEYINIHGEVANKDLQGLFKISAQAVHKELTKLTELKVIKAVGEGRALYYVLV